MKNKTDEYFNMKARENPKTVFSRNPWQLEYGCFPYKIMNNKTKNISNLSHPSRA